MSEKLRSATLFSILITERRWTPYRAFAERYQKAARELATSLRRPGLREANVSPRQFERWCAGDVQAPHSDARLILEHMFQIRVEDLFRLQNAGPTVGVAPDGGCVAQPGPAAPAPPSGIEEVVMSTANESARFAAHAERSNCGPHTLEQLDSDVRRIVTTYPNRPIVSLFYEVKDLRDRTFELLEGQQPPQCTKDLYLAAGALCGVLANASFDLGYFSAAETQARTGFMCAELAGHNGLRAWIRGLQALIAYWDGRPGDAIRLAASGHDFSPEYGTAHVRLASIEARAHGSMHNAVEALAAMRKAAELREQLTDDTDVPGGMMTFPLAKQLFYASSTHLWIAGPDHLREAESLAGEAVRLYEDDSPEQRRLGELSLARMDLATARLGRNEVEGAAEQVHTVLAIASRRPTESVARRLEHFARRLAIHPSASTPIALSLTDAVRAHRSRAALLPPGATA